MKKFLVTMIAVVVVIALLAAGCFGFYLGNQQEIDARFNKLLDDRINDYVENNRQEFIASVTPYIGHNGNWWIGNMDTGCPVTVEGRPGMSAYAVAVANGFQGTETEWLNSLKGANGKDGVDGQTPYIGSNNHWWIGDHDTGVKASFEGIYEHMIAIRANDWAFFIRLNLYTTNPLEFTFETLLDYFRDAKGYSENGYDVDKYEPCVGRLNSGNTVYVNVVAMSVGSATDYVINIIATTSPTDYLAKQFKSNDIASFTDKVIKV